MDDDSFDASEEEEELVNINSLLEDGVSSSSTPYVLHMTVRNPWFDLLRQGIDVLAQQCAVLI